LYVARSLVTHDSCTTWKGILLIVNLRADGARPKRKLKFEGGAAVLRWPQKVTDLRPKEGERKSYEEIHLDTLICMTNFYICTQKVV